MGTGAVRRYFLSYRRDDSKDVTLHLWEWLVRQVGSHSVFLDADGITPGIDYRDRIEDELNRCDVLLAVIGRNWLNIAHADGPKKVNGAWTTRTITFASKSEQLCDAEYPSCPSWSETLPGRHRTTFRPN